MERAPSSSPSLSSLTRIQSLLAPIVLIAGCQNSEFQSTSIPPNSLESPQAVSLVEEIEKLRKDCLRQINDGREERGLPPLERYAEAEPCTDQQVYLDFTQMKPHANFKMCGSYGQNECIDYPLNGGLEECFEDMWAEGPGEPGDSFGKNGHYINMTKPYDKVACGIFIDMETNRISTAQNFW